jgi:hypothetical protein
MVPTGDEFCIWYAARYFNPDRQSMDEEGWSNEKRD